MLIWQGLVWGAVGGAVVEAYDTLAVVRATGTWPWLYPRDSGTSAGARWNAFGLWLFATVVRIAAGGGVAAAASGQVSGALGAFGLGVAGPLALERLAAVTWRRSGGFQPSGRGDDVSQAMVADPATSAEVARLIPDGPDVEGAVGGD
jgi:hypothetical protein